MPILPELTLAIGAMALLLLGVSLGDSCFRLLNLLSQALLLLALLILLLFVPSPSAAFGGMVIVDSFALFMKSLVLIAGFVALMLAPGYLEDRRIARFEYPVLLLLATLGMLMMISANDLLALYVGLELQSLALYVLAAFDRDKVRSTEAGLKYFVLGALSSGMMLYGISLIYGFSGTTSFAVLRAVDGAGAVEGTGLLIGLVFLISGLAFKVSAVPFHMWTPDVYEGAPTPVTAFFAIAPKVAAMALFVRTLTVSFPDLVAQWQQIVLFLSVASMLLGAFAALMQTNIKRLMAYSSIAHVGYALTGLAAGTEQGVTGVIVYMTIYLSMTAGTFALILGMRSRDGAREEIAGLAGLARRRPGMALMMAILMFSLAGIPLLAGFFAKLYVFLAVVEAGLYWLAVVGFLSSVVGAVYYLRIVKIMYFDEPEDELLPIRDAGVRSVAILSAVLNSPVHLLLIPPLLLAAGFAARSLF